MNVYIAALIIACAGQATSRNWLSTNDIFQQSENMKGFLSEHKSRVEKVMTTTYEGAKNVKDSVNKYVEKQHKKIGNDFSNYVRNVKESGRKVIDSWMYVPSDVTESRMENPDAVLTVPARISRHGYTCETHTVVSQGYLLNIHRIPRSKAGGNVPKKTVFLQHGLLASSADWILNGPEKALAYVLADAGYDVWMSNIRGNKYSREHAWLKTDSKAYWNFSWHDVALHDVPAVIDYIMNIKGAGTKITYIGHSMGTTILFAMLSLRPEYNDILSAAFALAPVVFMSDLKSPLKSLAPLSSNVALMVMLHGSHEFFPTTFSLGRNSCKDGKTEFNMCKRVIFNLIGHDEKQLNKTLLPIFLRHLGTGTSWKTAVHFAQQVVSGGSFRQFDHGSYQNQKLYGTKTPPDYDLSKITLPIMLFWSQNDLLSSEKDVKMLYERLPSTTEMYMVENPEFNHLDYLWAVDAPSLVNAKVLDSLEKIYKDDRHFMIDIRFGE